VHLGYTSSTVDSDSNNDYDMKNMNLLVAPEVTTTKRYFDGDGREIYHPGSPYHGYEIDRSEMSIDNELRHKEFAQPSTGKDYFRMRGVTAFNIRRA